MFPPLTISPIRAPRSSPAIARIAASTVAALGSTTVFIRCRKKHEPSTIACSSTVTTRTACFCISAKFGSPSPVIRPSPHVTAPSTRGCRTPVAIERAASSTAFGSAPSICAAGRNERTTTAVPAHSPPPPTGATTTSRSGTSSSSSSAAVPWPAITCRFSNGCTIVAPVCCCHAAHTASRSVCLQKRTSAP